MIGQKSVLLVEDDSDLRFAVVDALQEEGYAVVAASNGREAIDRLLAEIPCVVLLDMRMPVMNGIEFRRAQLADHRIAAVPVVSFSASESERVEASASPRLFRNPSIWPDSWKSCSPTAASRLSGPFSLPARTRFDSGVGNRRPSEAARRRG